jgi:hypothetical protein
MLLGPTEDRVARYLTDRTAHGRVIIRSVDLAAALGLERSEAYRITARLRVLGLFGIENDRGGTIGGRRYWRTPTEHDGARLNAARHRVAWSRILAWARVRSEALAARLAGIRDDKTRQRSGPPVPGRMLSTPAIEGRRAPVAGGSFAELMRRAGLEGLMAEWGVS